MKFPLRHQGRPTFKRSSLAVRRCATTAKAKPKASLSASGQEFVKLMGRGALSMSNLQRLGAAVVEDGLAQTGDVRFGDLREFASLGHYGEHAHNAERDFHRKWRKLNGHDILPADVEVPKLQR